MTLIAEPRALREVRTDEAKELRRLHIEKTGQDYSPRRGKQLDIRNDGLANTLVCSDGKGNLIYDGNIRRLTPLEWERLQGFPDNWTATGYFEKGERKISDTRRYETLGNAVSTTVARAFAKKLYISCANHEL